MTRSLSSPLVLSRRAVVGLGALTVLTACGGRRWRLFGGRDEIETLEPEGGYRSALGDPRPLAPQVNSMAIETVTSGVIVRASGVMPTQDFWDANLVPAFGENPKDGVYQLDFRAWPPPEPGTAPVGPPQTRELTAAVFISNGTLEGVRTVTVVAQAGGLSRSR